MSIEETMQTFGFHIDKITMNIEMVSAHAHDAYEIYYLLQGSRVFFINNTFFRVNEGDFILVPEGELHRTAGDKCTRIDINFSKAYLRQYCTSKTRKLLLKAFDNYQVHPTKEDSERALNILLEMKKIFPERSDRIFVLLVDLLDILNRSKIVTSGELSKEEEKIQEIVEYTNKNFATIHSTQDVSNAFYLSKEYFCRLFKRNLGITFSDYLNKTKLHYATKLLITTNKRLNEIASLCGFHSSEYFCTIFKKEYGVTPNGYKKTHTKK